MHSSIAITDGIYGMLSYEDMKKQLDSPVVESEDKVVELSEIIKLLRGLAISGKI